jgi:hypothetical protein
MLDIAEVLSGESLVAPGGLVDRDTAVSDDAELWQHVQGIQLNAGQPELQAQQVSEPELVPV